MRNYIKTSANKALNEKREYRFLSSNTSLYLIEKFPPHISVKEIINRINQNIPNSLLNMIDGVYVGDFKELKNRNIQAMFKDGAIYVSSFKNIPYVSEQLIVNDICHELGHALEEKFYDEIYGDGKIEREYEGKKRKLLSLLKFDGHNIDSSLFFSDKKVDEFDNFLYNELTYDKLSSYISGLFMGPYSVTTIREYFANGLEDYLLGDKEYLKKISPVLYKKIKEIYNNVLGE